MTDYIDEQNAAWKKSGLPSSPPLPQSPCGCWIKYPQVPMEAAQVAYCPLHASAAPMLTLLREVYEDGLNTNLKSWRLRVKAILATLEETK